MKEEIKISRSLALKIRAALHTGGSGLRDIVRREAYGLPFNGGTYYSYKSSQLLKLSKTIDKKIKEL
jgi:predicted transcriptional regulator